MRIDEITINIPITIDLDGDKPRVNVAGQDADDHDLHKNPVMVAPQQQELELEKAKQGKESPIIDKILANNREGDEEDTDQDDNLENIKILSGFKR